MQRSFRSVLKILFLIGFSLVASGIARSQWRRSPGPQAGSISCMTSDADTLYAGIGSTFGGGGSPYGDVYRSTDLGEHWTSISGDFIRSAGVNAIAVTARAIYAGTSRGLVRLYKGTTNWDSISAESGYFRVDHLLASDTDIIATVQFGALYRSRDEGRTWVKIETGALQGTQINALDRIGTRLYAATQGKGVFRSDDNGLSWMQVSNGISGDNSFVFSLAHVGQKLYAGTLRGAFATTDEGATWDTVRTGIAELFGPQAFAVAPGALYAAVYGAGIYSFDLTTKKWSLINNGLGEFPSTSVVAAVQNKIFTATDMLGVLRSDNEAIGWERKTFGISNLSVYGLRYLPTGSTSTLFAGTLDNDFGIVFRSIDKAQHWTFTDSTTQMGVMDFAEHNGNIYAATSGDGVFVTEATSSHWTNTTRSISGGNYLSSMLSTPTAVLGGVNGQAVLLRTTDDGATWTTPLLSASTSITALFYDSLKSRVFAGSSFGIFTSDDDGATWTRPATAIDSAQILSFARVGTTILAGTRFGCFASSDDGATWALANAATSRLSFNALRTIGSVVFAAVPGGVLFSIDAGATWKTFGIGLPATIEGTSLEFDAENLYVGTVGFGVWYIPMQSSAVARSENDPAVQMHIVYAASDVRVEFDLLQSTDVRLLVHDEAGRQLFDAPLSTLTAGHYAIPMPKLPKGFYIATVRTPKTTSSASFISQP